MRYLAEDLIEEVKDITKAPPNISEASILRALNRTMAMKMVPMIKSVRQNYFLDYVRTPITAGKSRYTIPARAIGGAVSAIYYVDQTGARKYPIDRISNTEIENYSQPGDPDKLMFQGDEIVLYPTPAQSLGYIEFWAELRPNKIVATEECAKITAVSSLAGLTTFTVDTDLTGSISVGDKVDLVSGQSPHFLWAYDVSVTAITATTIEVATSAVSDEASSVEPTSGDYICLAKTTNIPTLPEELAPVLCHMASLPILRAIGDLNKLTEAKAEAKELAAEALKLIEDRLKSQPEVINVQSGVAAASGALDLSGFGI